MKKILFALFISGCISTSLHADLIDDYSGDLSNYTNTVILDANGGSSNTANWQISGGALQLETSSFDGIEQQAFIYGGLSLAVGQTLLVDVDHNGVSQDLGLYVGGTSPTTGVRENYLNVYARDQTTVFSRGFLGTSEVSLNGGTITPSSFDSLFITRDGINDYVLGYVSGSDFFVVSDRDNIAGNDATFVGLYSDVRGAGTLAALDNLRTVPEPSSLTLLGLGVLGILVRRRK